MAASPSYPLPCGFQPGALAAYLWARLPQAPPETGGHDNYQLNASVPSFAAGGIKAVVLIPVIARTEPVLLFTRRTQALARHSGQVSFPGGRVEAVDLTPLQTALRETQEETGIAPAHVTVAGYLGRHLTGTGFDIQPVVGLLAPGFKLKPNPAEVAEIFEVPLAFFIDPANRRRESRKWNGRQRAFYSFTYAGHEIWGATAAILVDLVERLDTSSPFP